MQKKISILLAITMLSVNISYAGANYTYSQPVQNMSNQKSYYNEVPQYAQNNTLKGRVVTVPAGQVFPAITTAPLSSASAYLGQVCSIALAQDFYYNGALVAPAGSSVIGNVIEVTHAKHGSLNGKLSIRFTQIVTPSGTQIPISAVIKTEDGTGVLVGGTKKDVAKEYGKDIVAGSAVGALSGVVFGALAGGSIGRGAALGTAVGAGGGLVKSVWDKGHDVEIPAGASFNLELTQPITTTPISTGY
ncbi:hypothetical protein J6O48_05095 [bacterium]|nr:hypothetical protein [bacterium]